MNTSKNWLWVLIAVALVIVVWAAWQYGVFNKIAPRIETPSPASDTTSQIDKDLNAVNIDNPDSDLKQLDSDLNRL